jgi:dihydroneopterin aldolase
VDEHGYRSWVETVDEHGHPSWVETVDEHGHGSRRRALTNVATEGAGERGLNTDRISLHGLRVFARHGVRDEERRDGQEFVIDAALWLDTRPAAAGDDLSLTVDYGALADRLVSLASGPPVRLIETLAQRLADACLSEPSVDQAEITVHKPHAPIAHPFDDVKVTIRRCRL